MTGRWRRAPVGSALFPALFLLGLMQDLRRVIANQGYPRLDVSVAVDRLVVLVREDYLGRIRLRSGVAGAPEHGDGRAGGMWDPATPTCDFINDEHADRGDRDGNGIAGVDHRRAGADGGFGGEDGPTVVRDHGGCDGEQQ